MVQAKVSLLCKGFFGIVEIKRSGERELINRVEPKERKLKRGGSLGRDTTRYNMIQYFIYSRAFEAC